MLSVRRTYHTGYGFIYVKHLKQVNPYTQNCRLVVARGWRGRDWGWWERQGFLVRGDENDLEPGTGGGCTAS